MTVARHGPFFTPTIFPDLTLQNLLDDFATLIAVFAFFGIVTPRPIAIDLAVSVLPTDSLGA